MFFVSPHDFQPGALQFAESLHLPGGFKLVKHLAISSYFEIMLSFDIFLSLSTYVPNEHII